MNIKEVMKKYGVTIKRISDRFQIPYRTVQNWASGQRECPSYIVKMMDEALKNDFEKREGRKMKVLAAIKKLYKEIGYAEALDDINNDYLTENTCRNGRLVIWYCDESKNVAIYVDTLEFLSEEEIENELC